MALLSVSGLSKKVGEGLAVNDISFTLNDTTRLVIAGETGSGKTTLLKMIGGLIQPDAGSIFLNDNRVKGPDEQLIPGHKKIAYLSQHFELRNNYRVHEVLSMANKLEENESTEIYRICKIEHLFNRWTDELSGGEKQRIALARLLSTSPQLMLLDEPFSNLDAAHKKIIQGVLKDITQQLKISCIMVSHDAADILSWADEILVLKEGRLIQQANPTNTYYQPVNEYTARLFGQYNILDLQNPDFAKLADAVIGTSHILVRPEQINIADNGRFHLTGMVEQVSFKGNFFIADILVGTELISVQTADNQLQAGSTVYLLINRYAAI